MHKLKKSLILLFSIGLVFVLQPVFAVDPDDFNPNFILSDDELQNVGSMDLDDIQAFLESHNSYLATHYTKDVDNKTRSAADIIYRAAHEHTISPKYLLVKLQKEQSLITTTGKPTDWQLDRATGYACPDSGGCNDKYKGFGKQVDAAAGIMRWYYDNAGKNSIVKQAGKTYTIDGQKVQPVTNATAFLYTYTPHIHGNKNFWILWNKWFDDPSYPNGTLVTYTDTPDVYLIQDGKKRKFANMTALTTRYDPKHIITARPGELNHYPTGAPVSLPNFSILRNGNKYYLVNYNILRPFADGAVSSFGYHPDEIIDVTSADIKDFTISKHVITPSQPPLGRLVRVKENNQLYYIEGDTFHAIYDDKIADINLSHLSEEQGSIATLQGLTKGKPILFRSGTLIGIVGHNEIYIINEDEREHIKSEEVFEGLGFKWENIVWTNEQVGNAYNDGRTLVLKSTPSDPPSAPTPPPSSGSPTPEEIAALMVRTPEDKQNTIGKQFSTNIDTYLVADAATGQLLSGKNTQFARPMASLTKVLTAYRLLKEGVGLTKTTTYVPSEHQAQYHYYRIAPGERVFNRDLMHAMLISSLNTPTRMLVDSVEPNESAFVSRMNDQVQQWDLPNTSFDGPVGLSEYNVTTAEEYLIIFQNVLKNGTIRDMLGMTEYMYDEHTDLDDKEHHHGFHTNKLVNDDDLSFTIEASKTGYLWESGDCLAMLVTRKSDNKQFVIITMGNPDHAHRFDGPRDLTNWALNNF